MLIDYEYKFIVMKEGVYMQGICGLFTEEDDAINSALKQCDDEPDNYHDFKVYKVRLNDRDDGDLIATISRYADEEAVVNAPEV